MNKNRSSFNAFLSLLLAALIFSSFGIFNRTLAIDLNIFEQILLRGFIGVLIILSILTYQKKQWRQTFTNVNKRVLIPYMVLFPLVLLFLTASILKTKIATSIFGLYAGSLIGSLFIGKLYFKEVFTLQKIIALLLAFLGLIVYTWPLHLSNFGLGLVLALISGLLEASSNAFRKYLSYKVDKITLVGIQHFGLIIVSLPFAILLLDNQLPTLSGLSLVAGVLLGLLSVAVVYLLLYAFIHVDLNLASIILTSKLFFAMMVGFLFYQEIPSLTEIIGSIVIVFAISLTRIKTSLLKNKIL